MMKKVFYSLICLIGLSACSSENVVLDALRVYDVANSTCKLSLSPTETRPDFYLENQDKPATLHVELGKDGIAQCILEDVDANCAGGNIHVNVSRSSDLYSDVLDVLTSCNCKYDVNFKMSQLLPGNYDLKVYYTGEDMKCKEKNVMYNGRIKIAQNKKTSVIFQSRAILPILF